MRFIQRTILCGAKAGRGGCAPAERLFMQTKILLTSISSIYHAI